MSRRTIRKLALSLVSFESLLLVRFEKVLLPKTSNCSLADVSCDPTIPGVFVIFVPCKPDRQRVKRMLCSPETKAARPLLEETKEMNRLRLFAVTLVRNVDLWGEYKVGLQFHEVFFVEVPAQDSCE